MSNLGDAAVKNYMESGFCCSESVWLAFAESDNLSKEERDFGNKLSFAFCGGTGARDLCGALAGGILVLGRYFGRVPGEERNPAMAQYTEALIGAFKEKFGHTSCLDLKPEDPTISKATCREYVRFVTEKIDELIENGLGDEDDCG